MEIVRDSIVGHAARLIAPHKFRYPDEIEGSAAGVLARDQSRGAIISSFGTLSNDSASQKETPADDPTCPLESNRPHTPVDLDSKTILCDWNGDNDPENPRNWPRARKLFVVANVAFCSFVVYGTAPIWTPSTKTFMSEYGAGHEYTSLGLSLFV
jgi:DHA1 family multidrug resistance protein-like MFS transporter